MFPGGSAHSAGASRFAGLGRGVSGNGCCKSSASITSAVMTAGIASCTSASEDARTVHRDRGVVRQARATAPTPHSRDQVGNPSRVENLAEAEGRGG
jgi:hypothetical protein